MIDDWGRLFGRVNLIDAALALFLFALVPLAYGSWVFLRTPPPVIEQIPPTVIAPDREDQQIEVRGLRLRPFLRADVGTRPANFVFDSPESAHVHLPALGPGTYDLAFFDSAKEVARYPNVVIVKPDQPPATKPLTEVRIRVRFVTPSDVLAAVKRAQHEAAASEPSTGAPAAVLLSYEVTDELRGTTRPERTEGPISIVRGLVRVMATRTANGWEFGRQSLKAGAPFRLETDSYVLQGVIVSVAVADFESTANGHA